MYNESETGIALEEDLVSRTVVDLDDEALSESSVSLARSALAG
jgi:hypothetical protein